jgi:beta-lactamase regulating signal transducer with metallopeptidase domain
MIDRLMGALLSASGRAGGLAWLILWQSTLWLAIGLVAARVWRRRAGRAHLLLVLAMVAAFLSPPLTVTVRRMQWGFLPAPPEPRSAVTSVAQPEPAAPLHQAIERSIHEPTDRSTHEADEFSPAEPESMPAQPAAEVAESDVATSEPPAREESHESELTKTAIEPAPALEPAPPPWTTRVAGILPVALAAAWSIASFLLMVRLAISLLAGMRIVRTSHEEHNPPLLAALGEATAALGLRALPNLRVSPRVRCPMIWCWSPRPVVLLPASAAEAAPILWRSVFCHELAHAIRRDHWTALWAEIVVIALPWQPLGWLCRRRLAYLREQACDDWVLAVGGEATDYAESLLQLVPQGTPAHALAAVSSRESLKRRLEHVLSGVRITPNVGRHWLLASTLLALAAIAGVGFAQQGKRAAAPTPEPAPELALADETKPPTPATPAPSPQPTAKPDAPAATNPTPTNVVAESPSAKASTATTIRELRGRVLLPNGQPAAGARVRVVKSIYGVRTSPRDEVKVLALFSTGSQGDFQLKMDARVEKEMEHNVNVWAMLPGYGAALHVLVPNAKTDTIVMRLAEEEPIRGRLIDLEGRPVPGARVEVLRYFDTMPAAIDEWLASIPEKQKPVNALADKTVGALKSDSMDWARQLPNQAILHVNSIQVVSADLFPATTTNADGRFELRGIGRARLLAFRISAPRLATVFVTCLARPIPTLPFQFQDVCGSSFERVASPSAFVEGRVLDADSGEPIAGADVSLPLLSRQRSLVQALGVPIATKSDSKGHYRLEGLDTLKPNQLAVDAPDSPYFPELNQSAPPAKTLEPVQFDVKLKRGVWVEGRTYDRSTNKPVAGSIGYTPFPSNKFARNRVIAGNAFTDADGRFRVLAVPGRGLVSFYCEQGDYRFDLGKTQIKGIDQIPFPEFTIHSVREVNIAPNEEEAHVDLPVDPGENLRLKFVDASGKPLSGVDTFGLRFPPSVADTERGRSFVEGDSATLYAIAPEDTRTIWLRHRATGLARLIEFKPKPGETERTIVLNPPAILTGRFVTPEGTPLDKIGVACDIGSASRFQVVRSDAEGRIRGELPPGGPVSLSGADFHLDLARDLTIVAGETIDLGTITVDRNPKKPRRPKVDRHAIKRLPPPRADARAAKPPAAVDAPANHEASKTDTSTQVVRGRVLLPNGQPAVGARVGVVKSRHRVNEATPDEVAILDSVSADARGEFHVPVDGSLIKETGPRINLYASLPGYGLALHPLAAGEKFDSFDMRLAEEQTIRGRVIDLEAQPVRGARVEAVRYVDLTTAAVDEWLAAARREGKPVSVIMDKWIGELVSRPLNQLWGGPPQPVLHVNSIQAVSEAIVPATQTNADGRFEFKGIGRDRLVVLRISSPRTATAFATSLTRPLDSIPEISKELVGPQFDRIVAQSAPIDGFVTEEGTGKPIPGAIIDPNMFGRHLSSLDLTLAVGLPSISDAKGHYRLEGLDTLGHSSCIATVRDLPYFGARIEIPASKHFEPIQLDIKLKRGVWAVGRAYDQVTGKPVAGHVSYAPSPSNKLRRGSSRMHQRGAVIDADGRFRVLVLPGRGMVYMSCQGEYRFNAGASQVKDFRGFSRTGINRVCAIDVPPNATEAHVDMPADPGQNVVLKFTDAADKALSGVDAFGLRYQYPRPELGYARTFSEGDSATIYAVSPEDMRTVWLRQRGSGLTKVLRFKQQPGETQRTITLQPPAIVRGRFITPEGKPISGTGVSCFLDYAMLPAIPGFDEVHSDAEGRFRRDVPAGARVTVTGDGSQLLLTRELLAASGEIIDLGDITVEPDRKHPGLFDARHGPEKRTKPAAVPTATTASASTSSPPATQMDAKKPSEPTLRELRGRVLLPNGQPAVGATVRVTRAGVRLLQFEPIPLASCTTNSSGAFEGHLDAAEFKDRRPISIWAMLPGYGLVVRPLPSLSDAQPIALQLAQEEPIRGRIVDLEGRPVRDSRVEVVRYFDTTTNWVDQWLAAVSKLPRPVDAYLDDEGDSDGRPAPGGAYLHVSSPQFVSETLIPAVKTDSDGRFEMRGLGRDRLVGLRLSAPRVATTFASVLTRPIPSIPLQRWEVHGSEFTRVVTPSVPVEGFITDEDNGKPVAGATVAPYTRSDIGRWRVELGVTLYATTDARGHYLLEGLNTQQPNICGVFADDLPYLNPWYEKPMETGAGFEVPAAADLRPIRRDVKLKRGIWAVGRACDRATGKPVSGWVQYTPFRSNDVARKYHVRQGTSGKIDAEGRFRVLVVPGRGVIMLYCDEGNYRLALGQEEIADFSQLTFAPYAPYQAAREINVASDAQEAHADLAADPGQKVVLKFADAAGKPLAGVEAYGLRYVRYQPGKGYLARPWWSFVESDSAMLYATFPGETRTVWLKHRASGLTKLFRFTPKEGEAERTIVLEPPAVITARFLTPEGTPLKDWSLTCTPAYNLPEGLPTVSSDAQGRLHSEIPAGLFVSVVTGGVNQLEKNLTVASGEQIDFGDIVVELDARQRRITKLTRGPLKRLNPGVAEASAKPAPHSEVHLVSAASDKKPAPPAPPATTTRELRGRVLLPNGQPAVGATVRAMTVAGWPLYWPEGEAKLLGNFSTKADGTFEGKFNAPSRPRPASANQSVGGKHWPVVGVDVNLWATLPGYGLALVPLDSVGGHEPIVIKLADEETIHGHLLDLEARPIRDAKVEVIHYAETTSREVDQFIASARATKKEYQESLLPENRAYEVASASIVPSVKTDSDGRFELKGVGRDRVVELRISAPKMTTAIAWVLTRPIKPIELRFGKLLGSPFERVIPPSAPVEGLVTDADTGKPIPGARVRQFSVNNVQGPWAYLSATTDARGHYRIEGVETESFNDVSVSVPDSPYFSRSRVLITPAKSLEAIREDIKLRRGVWGVGRAYDRTTHKPVSGRIEYVPFKANEFAKKFREEFFDLSSQNCYADAEGHFRAVVMPGRGVLCLICRTGEYRFDFGKSDIKEFARSSPSPRQAPESDFLPSDRYHSVRAIDAPSNSEEVHVDLPVDPGQNVVLKFTDAAGKPLAGVDTHGLRSPIGLMRMEYEQSFIEGDSAVLYATYPGETRHVWLKHRRSGLTKLFDLVTKAGETERTIVLDPPAFVTGRLVTEYGVPLARAPLRTESRERGFRRSLGLATGDDGRFRVELPAGGPFELSFGAYVQLVDKLTLEPGEQVDLGEITIEQKKQRPFRSKVERGPEKRTKLHPTAKTVTQSPVGSSSPPAPPKADSPKPTSTTRELRGRVLLPNGQPAVGATVTLTRSDWQPDGSESTTMLSLRTDSQGAFRGDVEIPADTRSSGELILWATLPKYGLAFRPFSLRGKGDAIVMNLVPDEPVRGHLIDVDGRPVRDARVEPITLRDSTAAWVDEFIASAKDKPVYTSWVYPGRTGDDEAPGRERAVFRVKASASIPGSLIPTVKTRADGRFEIAGLGGDRHVDLKISGPRVATTVEGVVTRPIKPIVFQFREVYGSQFERVAAPSVPITGTVVDEESGKPVPGVAIRPFARRQGAVIVLATGPLVSATSDAQGHFRLEGLDTGAENQIRIDVGTAPYLARDQVLVPASVGLKPIELEVKLHHAIWVTGRAYDRATGLPVKGNVYYTPFRSNEFAKKYGVQRPIVWLHGTVEADGHFRMPVIPGRGVVCLDCNGNDYRFDVGRSEINELANAPKKLTGADSPTLMPLEELRYQCLREVSVAPDAREVRVDLPVERGENVLLKFTDAAGKPLAGVDAYGLHGAASRGYSSTETNTAPLRATFPGETRPIWLRHRASGLMRLFDFTTKPGETERTIVLEKPAVVTGQLVSEEGTPLSRVRIECLSPVPFPSASTDREGRFHFELPAGGTFELTARVPQLSSDYPRPAVLVDKLTVESGEQIDLGRLTVEPGTKGLGLPKVRRGTVKRTPAVAASAKEAK